MYKYTFTVDTYGFDLSLNTDDYALVELMQEYVQYVADMEAEAEAEEDEE